MILILFPPAIYLCVKSVFSLEWRFWKKNCVYKFPIIHLRNRKYFPCFYTVLVYSFSKNLVIYYCKCCNLIGYTTHYLFVNRYRVVASNATRPSFSQKKCLFLVFWNNFEEITNTSLFLLKQLDYSLSISMKWSLNWASPSLWLSRNYKLYHVTINLVNYSNS